MKLKHVGIIVVSVLAMSSAADAVFTEMNSMNNAVISSAFISDTCFKRYI